MNIKEWNLAVENRTADYTFRIRSREIQKSLIYNSNPEAKVIHHLRDTEEQRKYNDEHYELWGHNLDGTFEYGKYVIFVTQSEHAIIHSRSEEVRERLRKAMQGKNNPMYGKPGTRRGIPFPEELKKKFSNVRKGENNVMYGKHHSTEVRKKIGEASKKLWERDTHRKYMSDKMRNRVFSEEHRRKISESKSGSKNAMYGKPLSEEHRKNISASMKGIWTEDRKKKYSELLKGHEVSEDTKNKIKMYFKEIKKEYEHYKEDGGNLSWNDFRSYYSKEQKEIRDRNKIKQESKTVSGKSITTSIKKRGSKVEE